jgi:hypothetical protein
MGGERGKADVVEGERGGVSAEEARRARIDSYPDLLMVWATSEEHVYPY